MMEKMRELTRTEAVFLLDVGFKKLGVRAGTPEVASMALFRAMEADFDLTEDSIGRTFELDRALGFCKKELERLDIPESYLPPRILVRHALALMISYQDTVDQLAEAVGCPVVDTLVLMRGRRLVDTPQKAYEVADSVADELLAVIFRGRGL